MDANFEVNPTRRHAGANACANTNVSTKANPGTNVNPSTEANPSGNPPEQAGDPFSQVRLAVTRLSDDELVSQVVRLAGREREATAALVAHLRELDARRLYCALGFSSLFTYCTEALHLSEHAAYLRIEAARAARRFPIILEQLADGSVHLTAVGLLASHLTQENHRRLLEAARHQSKRRVEDLIARIRPLPPVPSSIRKLPEPGSSPSGAGNPTGAHPSRTGRVESNEPGSPAAPAETGPGLTVFALAAVPAPGPPPAVVAPLAPGRYRVQFTASGEFCEKLRQAQDLLRHQIPDGDPAAIFDRALAALLEQLRRQKHAATRRPRGEQGRTPPPGPDRNATRTSRIDSSVASPSKTGSAPTGASTRDTGSRHIPAAVKRTVWDRDGGRCAFVSRHGRRCAERGALEFHHVEPYAVGGPATTENISLRCRAHNGYESEIFYGRRYVPVVRDELGPDRVPYRAANRGSRDRAAMRPAR
jgi:hypothetical protein